ncbi:MAG: FG-GAP repeat domain-containing protein [Emticicia sp.]
MNFLKIISYFSFIGLLFTLSCNKQSEGEKLAQTYCASCHLFPEPSLLDKTTWKNNIMPVMATQLGLQIVNGEVYPDIQQGADGKFESVASITPEEWAKIVAYYEENAPEKLPNQGRKPISAITNLFSVKPISIPQSSFPSLTFIKIDSANQQIYAASDATLSIFDKKATTILAQKVEETIVDIDFGNTLQKAGNRTGYFTNIGILNPNDLTKGSLHGFDFAGKNNFKNTGKTLENLTRPVQSISVDLDKDGLIDQLICGYGNKNGSLIYYKNLGKNNYKALTIRALPGAIKTYIDDVNKDGLPDIWVLFAQAQEGIFLFTNKGKDAAGVLQFDTKEILRFSPVQGSSFFELVDLNKDGHKDILYTSGDNADYSTHLLKNFHGVYGYLNDGKNNFKQAFFYPINGCFKALARDFDKDGDLDIATISYFPDFKNQPKEGFVYLENKGKFEFSATSIKEVNAGNWLVMDAADLDADGDEDIVLGNFDRKKRGRINESKKDTAVLVLVNRLK